MSNYYIKLCIPRTNMGIQKIPFEQKQKQDFMKTSKSYFKFIHNKSL